MVPQDGYVWWYVDALSDDGASGITIIAFIGSVFSPYYAFARRRGRGDPQHHCAVNVALYGRRKGWAMTERGRSALSREAASLRIGPSALTWDGDGLSIDIDETTAPIPKKIRGRVRLRPSALEPRVYGLDDGGRHTWRPIAPCARVEVALEHPALRWSGPGYFDTNAGAEPLERGFARWDWCRAPLASGGTAVLYDVTARRGADLSMGLRFAPGGGVEAFAPPPRSPLPRTPWRMARAVGCEEGHTPGVQDTLEDSPFYARSVVRTHVVGEAVTGVHESLSLDRFSRPWMQLMLPFRMPRKT